MQKIKMRKYAPVPNSEIPNYRKHFGPFFFMSIYHMYSFFVINMIKVIFCTDVFQIT